MTVPRLLTVALLATFVFALLPAPGAMAAPKKVPPGMAVVEGGEFEMGMPERTLKKNWKGKDSTLELLATESPAHKVEIGEFFMDKYEVTNAQYKAFLDDKHKTVVKVGGNLNTLARIAVSTLSGASAPWPCSTCRV